MTTKILSATLDFIFKLIFGDEKNADILGSFLMAVLNPPYDEFDSLQIIDPNLPREFEEDKLGILDVKLKLKSGKIIDVEIQVKLLPHLRERIVFYTSKMITEQIKSGNDYHVIKPVVTILVADFVMFPDDTVYHHIFEMYDRKHNIILSDLTGVHILELPKLPQDDDDTPVWTWVKFIKTVNEEELQMLAQRNSMLNKAVAIRIELSQDERLRLLAEAREKARRDEADLLWGARQEGRKEERVRVITLLRDGYTPEQIEDILNSEQDDQ
jgi:predicted transposase/invertase (TIGR01784 family)